MWRKQDALLSHVVNNLLPVDATARGGRVHLGELIIGLGAVDVFLKHGLGLVELKLGLEVLGTVGIPAAVGPTAGIRQVEVLVNNLLADATPIGRHE